MIINRVDLADYNYHKVNSEYLFKPGLNMIVGDNASGKTTILHSIISVFSAGIFQEQWRGLGNRYNFSDLYPHQEPVIAIEFQSQKETYCITKKMKKDGIECVLYSIDELGERSLVCEGVEAIERSKQYSEEIIFLGREEFEAIREQLGILNIDEQLLPEFQILWNELLQKYAPFPRYWFDKHVAVVEGQTVVVDRNGASVPLAAGAVSFLVLMSIVASLKLNKNCPILIMDDLWVSMDHSSITGVKQCFREMLDSQMIFTSHSMHLPDIEVESHIIQLNR